MVTLQRKLRGENQQQSSEYQKRWDIDVHILATKEKKGVEKRKFAREIGFLREKNAMVCVYITKTTSLSHSQLPFMQRAGAKALPPVFPG